MPNTWTESLSEYSYPFDLSDFEDAGNYPEWFELKSSVGDRDSTIKFEDHFRNHAAEAIEPWLEVVYWKIYSQPTGRADRMTQRVASYSRDNDVPPQLLWYACNNYVENPTRKNLEDFRMLLLGLRSRTIALACTFPAFLKPELYPMVDTRIAKWVGSSMNLHNNADPSGPQLIRPKFLDSQQTTLTMTDFEFVETWISWCRHTARKLTERTLSEWRSRDVEMAVFSAWGGRHDTHPKLHLNPLKKVT